MILQTPWWQAKSDGADSYPLTACHTEFVIGSFHRLILDNSVENIYMQDLSIISKPHLLDISSKYDDAKAEYIYQFIHKGCNAIISNWLNKEHREPPKEIAALIVKLVSGAFNNIL